LVAIRFFANAWPRYVAVAAAGLLAASAAQAQRSVLFDGSLAGWSVENTTAGNIGLESAVLRVMAPGGWLKSAGSYENFALDVEVRFLTDDADSGIFVRAVADGVFGRGWPANSYQVQLRNPVGESPFPAVGGIFRHGKPPGDTRFDAALAAATSKGTGEWQVLLIEVIGTELRAALNGVELTRAAGIENSSGFIGIQAETGALEFRRIEIEER
jgi:hypothetical protein